MAVLAEATWDSSVLGKLTGKRGYTDRSAYPAAIPFSHPFPHPASLATTPSTQPLPWPGLN